MFACTFVCVTIEMDCLTTLVKSVANIKINKNSNTSTKLKSRISLILKTVPVRLSIEEGEFKKVVS